MRQVFGEGIPRAGHYSSAAVGGGFTFVSGQGPLVPETGRVIDGDFRAKARQCLRNIEAVLKSAGGTLDDVVKTTVFLHDWSDFGTLNEVYAEGFPVNPPARSTIQGTRPPGHALAIEAIAIARR
ncbi:MAG TPA: Rid family hydrolase [Candidatus Thermoplasmatota archaeon]|nr:Rid family hydrolase [Candidatus Thermoplasmatota archaeon]